ncbi:SpoIIIAH-like family protein [Pallidibacillus pasinlerensis]|uniref:SpoIIIAH-like family protein n=1 Tax=Pallidibacillus pasinlerensis TaxID=2703818 RepID=A0ABX0A493_9BACI|nr:SpoIIIAH-like family protein [Pallidibacillus pasinlerensis]NCU16784.1 SpoIIIAH-like family protein [Pallidibacillus pasinlerensis]
MMLKKQTVWLLTMLSLVVVLSVYYITAEPPKNDVASVDNEQNAENTDEGTNTTITQVSKDEVFEEIRLQMIDERSQKLEELQQMAGSNELSAAEKSAAKDEMERIQQIADKEKLVESLIVSNLGYEDALVQVEDDEVLVTVKGMEPTKANANEIIKIVKKEIGSSFVSVAYENNEEETK